MTRTIRVFLLSLLLGCGETARVAAPELPAGAPVSIAPAPDVTIGVADGDTLQELDRVGRPFLIGGGRIAVPLRDAATIRVFGPDGAWQRSLGRPGSGPGEFQEVTSAWLRGDTIEALDAGLRRITRFLPDGSTEVVALTAEQFDLAIGGPMGSGWVAGGVVESGWGRRDAVGVRRFDRSGSDLGEIGRVDGMQRFRVEGYGGPAPLSARAIVAVHGDRLYLADGYEPRIVVLDSSGTPDREITWSVEPGPDPGQTLRMVRDSVLAHTEEHRKAFVWRIFDGSPVADRLPVAWSVLSDEAGFVWVQSWDPLAHALVIGATQRIGRVWRVFARDGAAAGTIEMPRGFEPAQIARDVVLGVARDDLGVETVRVYALERR